MLREHGFCKAYRTQQYSGAGPDSSDVTCPELPGIHWEVKRVEAGSPYVWMEQAIRDAHQSGTIPIVAHKRNGREWLAVLRMEDMLSLIRETEGVK